MRLLLISHCNFLQTTFTLEGDAFIQTQLGKPCDVVMERRLENDGNLMVEVSYNVDIISKVVTIKYNRPVWSFI